MLSVLMAGGANVAKKKTAKGKSGKGRAAPADDTERTIIRKSRIVRKSRLLKKK